MINCDLKFLNGNSSVSLSVAKNGHRMSIITALTLVLLDLVCGYKLPRISCMLEASMYQLPQSQCRLTDHIVICLYIIHVAVPGRNRTLSRCVFRSHFLAFEAL